VVYEYLGHSGGSINFITRESGTLVITKAEGGMLSMSFPIIPLVPFTQTEAVTKALGAKPVSVWRGNYSENQYDVMAVFSHESDVATLCPLFNRTLLVQGIRFKQTYSHSALTKNGLY